MGFKKDIKNQSDKIQVKIKLYIMFVQQSKVAYSQKVYIPQYW